MPQKPCKFGVKMWVLAEATTGYVLGFQVYTGAVLPAMSPEDHTSKGLVYRVVMDLMEPYQGKGHCLFMDNFYTSVDLVQELLKRGTYSTGTICPNRKNFPEDSKVDKKNVLEIGNFRFATFNDLTVVLWRDRRDVFVLSSMHSRSVDTVMKRPQGERDKKAIPCPTSIRNYNLFMSGVDLADQQLSYYSLTQKRTIKWGKKVFWHLINTAIINSWIIFKVNNLKSKIKSQRDFCLALIKELIQPLLDLKASPSCPAVLKASKGRKSVSPNKRLLGKHFAYKSAYQGRCAMCSRRRTTIGKKVDKKKKQQKLLSQV